jgi:hypothetical protein
LAYFIATHKPLEWELPFATHIIGLEGFRPEGGIAASDFISRSLDYETAFGGLRSYAAIKQVLSEYPDQEDVFSGSYRLFLSTEMSDDWLSPIMQENRVITPEQLQTDWQTLIASKIPDDIDLLIPSPRLLPDTLLGQYARVHHNLDDFLFGVACAVRSGLLDQLTVPTMLASNTLVPYGLFAAKKDFRLEFNDRLWWCAKQFYKEHYIPRDGYQRRVIDFVFERISSMALITRIVREELRCRCCRNIVVAADGIYQSSS